VQKKKAGRSCAAGIGGGSAGKNITRDERKPQGTSRFEMVSADQIEPQTPSLQGEGRCQATTYRTTTGDKPEHPGEIYQKAWERSMRQYQGHEPQAMRLSLIL
jgi:hypothetical protein